MLQLKVYNDQEYWLDLYDEEPIKLTLSVDDLESFTARSTFSRSFRVPGTGNNNEFFKHAFMVSGVDFDVTVKHTAAILVDGASFRDGHIRLQKIYHNREQDTIEYEIVFLGETRDLASRIGDVPMCELDLQHLSHARTYANITQSWQAYPQGGPTDGLLSGDVLYPLIDFGNTYDDAGVAEQTRIASDSSPNFTQNANPLLLDRFKPMIRAKAIWDAMFTQAGYTYSSEFLNSDRFRHIYISAFGNQASVSYTPETYTIVADINGDIFDEEGFGGIVYVRVFVDGSQVASNSLNVTYTGGALGGNVSFNLSVSTAQVLTQGQDVWIEFDYSGALSVPVIDRTSTFQISPTPGLNNDLLVSLSNVWYDSTGIIPFDREIQDINDNYSNITYKYTVPIGNNIGTQLNCEYKQIDFLKDILTAFRLVLAPDPVKNFHFIVEPWDVYIASGQERDWSGKLDGTKDIEMEPLFYTQTRLIDYTLKEAGDYLNDYHQRAFREVYGGNLKVDSGNELLDGEKQVKLLFSPTPMQQIEGEDSDTTFIIPQLHAHDADDNGIQHDPTSATSRMLFYNGLKTPTWSSANWKLFSGASVISQTQYPQVSVHESWPPADGDLQLMWRTMFAYWGNNIPGYNSFKGAGLYARYWENYIDSLYSKDARRITATFILNNTDLQDLTFDDVIFINGTWYRIEKISDAMIGDKAPTKVSLIKLLNYIPQTEDVDIGDWDDNPVDWNEEPAGWGVSGAIYYYLLSNCDGESPFIIGKSNVAYSFGDVVNVSGAPYVGQCYTIVDVPIGTAYNTTILSSFTTCEECALA